MVGGLIPKCVSFAGEQIIGGSPPSFGRNEKTGRSSQRRFFSSFGLEWKESKTLHFVPFDIEQLCINTNFFHVSEAA